MCCLWQISQWKARARSGLEAKMRNEDWRVKPFSGPWSVAGTLLKQQSMFMLQHVFKELISSGRLL